MARFLSQLSSVMVFEWGGDLAVVAVKGGGGYRWPSWRGWHAKSSVVSSNFSYLYYCTKQLCFDQHHPSDRK